MSLLRPNRTAMAAEPQPQAAAPPTRPWYLSTIGLALAGSALMWAALPPLDCGLLGWVAPVCWVALIRRRHLDGQRPYLNIFFAGFVFWLAALYWLTLPHWSAAIGWVLLALYLACYVTLFIGLSRVAVQRLGVSVLITAPVVWTGLEWLRAHLFTGFLLASLSHTQYRWTTVIQISDLVGAYGVSFLVMLVAACVARMLPIEKLRAAIWPLAPLVVAMAATLLYGQWRMAAAVPRTGPKVALIQGNIDTVFGRDPRQMKQEIRDQYVSLARQALKEQPDIQLMVWPESMFWAPLMIVEKDAWLPASMFEGHPYVTEAEAKDCQQRHQLPLALRETADITRSLLTDTVAEVNPARAGDPPSAFDSIGPDTSRAPVDAYHGP
ncbi:MAG: hypothetical protein K8T25_01555, partial [Planctomycetia bacterium]|nr:hypothetical protein [Planctomycetia bacterium]